MEHLSPAWIAAFDDVVRAHDGLRVASSPRHVVVQFTVADPPPGSRRSTATADEDTDAVVYSLVFDHGDNRVVAGPHPDPDITFRTDRGTAAAIATHTESAQAAFMAGRIRLGGDVRVLIANQDLLAGIDDCTRALRDATEPAPATDGPAGA